MKDQHEIRVWVTEFSDRKKYQMQYIDPMTGRKKTRTTGILNTGRKKDLDEAKREAAKWEDQLREGRYQDPSKVTWQLFRERYEDEVLPSLAKRTDERIATVFNSVEEVINPTRLRDLTPQRLSHYQSKLREAGRSENTIATNLAHLKAALNWAVKQGMLPKLPYIERPKRVKGSKMMKGRPITREEFERMLAKIESVVVGKPPKDATPQQITAWRRKNKPCVQAWSHFLEGLWSSGLRLGESLDLYWDRDDKICVDMERRRPMLRIRSELEKGNQDRMLPITPDFAALLEKTPKAKRTGPVFNPATRDGNRPTEWWVSRTISKIGEEAKVKVDTKPARGEKGPTVKYASAHDLRRSFGERWATKIMPQVLMQLMRHESIETTMKFYVGRNADAVADAVWATEPKTPRRGNIRGNNGHKTPNGDQMAAVRKPLSDNDVRSSGQGRG